MPSAFPRLLTAAFAILCFAACKEQIAKEAPRAARQAPRDEDFSGRAACAQCHAAEAAAWAGSDHDRAMDTATDATVEGRFEGDSLAHPGGGFRFRKTGGAFIVDAPGPDGARHPYPVRYVFGVRPLQQYLVPFPGGRLQALPAAWDVARKRWFHLAPDSVWAPDDWLHWSRDAGNWNGMCADCHSTGLKRGYDAQAGTFRTTWREIDVSCEACHGPGAAHAAWAKAQGASGSQGASGAPHRYGRDPIPPAPGQPARADGSARDNGMAAAHGLAWDRMLSTSRDQVDGCARCHARRSALREDFAYGRFLDGYAPSLLTPDAYHADGQIRDEDYEYGSFLQSKMYHAGVRCSDCHDPHSLRVKAPGNALCVRCHEAARYDAPSHHHHDAGSAGASCTACHMPTRTYMGIDVRRDHSLRIPRPDLGVRFGTPDACTQCHRDRNAAWAAARIAAWDGPARRAHFSELLAKGRAGGPGADSALAALASDTSTPAIARATAVALLAGYMRGLAGTAIANAARDGEPLVRMAAATASANMDEDKPALIAGPLLRDSVRAVRVAAAEALVAQAPLLAADVRSAFDAAAREAREALAANAVFPGGRFNLAFWHERAGRADSAEIEYRRALALDDRLLPARMNLAQLYARTGRPDSAAAEFRAALRRDPANAEVQYSLGLLLAEGGSSDSAAAHLALAERGMPGNARVSYNLGLLLRKMGRLPEAEAALGRAAKRDPADADVLYAWAWVLSQGPHRAQALEALRRLEAVRPGYPGADALEASLRLR